jgi:hypothetical protein
VAKEKENMDPEKLNELLKQSFLNNQDKMPDDCSDFVFSRDYNVKIDPLKEQNFLKKISGAGTSGSNFLYVLLSFAGVLIIGAVIYFSFFHNSDKPAISDDEPAVKDTILSPEKDVLQTGNLKGLTNYEEISLEEKKHLNELNPLMNKELQFIIQSIDTVSPASQKQIVSENYGIKDKIALNEKMIGHFKMIKKMMIEKLISRDKKLYAAVYPGSVSYLSEDRDVDAFYLRTCLITNLEYKTFLVDLLIQGKNEEYEKAKVNSEIWKNYNMPHLAENYFTGSEYNDFPVVNISYEGAIMFCNWLEEESMIYAEKTGQKLKSFNVRLPYDLEWIHIIMYGYARIPDYDGYHTIFDINEGYVDKLLVKRLNSLKKTNKSGDPVYELFAVNRFRLNETQVLDIYNQGFKIHETFPSDTIYPKRMKDFGKIGYVSEMIIEKQNENFKVSGFCWKDKEEFLEMMTSFSSAKASPFVGMRIVISYENAPVYKNPFF